MNPNRVVSSFSSLVVSFVCTGWGTYPGACFGSVIQEQAPSCVQASISETKTVNPQFFAFLALETQYLTAVKILKKSIEWKIFAPTSLNRNILTNDDSNLTSHFFATAVESLQSGQKLEGSVSP